MMDGNDKCFKISPNILIPTGDFESGEIGDVMGGASGLPGDPLQSEDEIELKDSGVIIPGIYKYYQRLSQAIASCINKRMGGNKGRFEEAVTEVIEEVNQLGRVTGKSMEKFNTTKKAKEEILREHAETIRNFLNKNEYVLTELNEDLTAFFKYVTELVIKGETLSGEGTVSAPHHSDKLDKLDKLISQSGADIQSDTLLSLLMRSLSTEDYVEESEAEGGEQLDKYLTQVIDKMNSEFDISFNECLVETLEGAELKKPIKTSYGELKSRSKGIQKSPFASSVDLKDLQNNFSKAIMGECNGQFSSEFGKILNNLIETKEIPLSELIELMKFYLGYEKEKEFREWVGGLQQKKKTHNKIPLLCIAIANEFYSGYSGDLGTFLSKMNEFLETMNQIQIPPEEIVVETIMRKINPEELDKLEENILERLWKGRFDSRGDQYICPKCKGKTKEDWKKELQYEDESQCIQSGDTSNITSLRDLMEKMAKRDTVTRETVRRDISELGELMNKSVQDVSAEAHKSYLEFVEYLRERKKQEEEEKKKEEEEMLEKEEEIRKKEEEEKENERKYKEIEKEEKEIEKRIKEGDQKDARLKKRLLDTIAMISKLAVDAGVVSIIENNMKKSGIANQYRKVVPNLPLRKLSRRKMRRAQRQHQSQRQSPVPSRSGSSRQRQDFD